LGTPAFFAREYFTGLLKLEGPRGAKKLLEGLGDQVLPLDLPEAAQDLDTPEDFAAFISTSNKSPETHDAFCGVEIAGSMAMDKFRLEPTPAVHPPGQTRRQFMTNVTITGASVVAFPGLLQTLHGVEAPAAAAVAATANSAMVPVKLRLNGNEQTLQLDPRVTLLDALRENLGLTGTKKGCDHGQCGACTVLVNGHRINSCLALAVVHDGDEITTIEGFAHGDELHPVQKAFLEHDGFQCGYCTPGQICSAVALLKEGHAGSDDEIREWMSGNICRCGAYTNIVAAIRQAKTAQVGAI
jgi:xanthine dehydrogenase YagT iron-sulfur-binding subunit